MSFPRYPKYKPSGVEWLGEVPEHWVVKPVRQLAAVVNGFPFDSKLFDAAEGIPLIRIRDLNQVEADTCYKGEFVERAAITSDDVLVGMDGDFNVGRWLGTGRALLNQRMCCIRGKSRLLTRLLEYSLPIPLKAINEVTYATTVKHLASSQIEKTFVALPPTVEEQTAIAEFLDRETGKIDGLVAEQRRLMELLKEKRQAVISHAVTKGLNPHAPMKPSGIEWLGDVPEHWETAQLRHFVDIENGTDHKHVEQSEGFPVYGSGGIFAYASDFLYNGESVLLGRKGTINKPLYVNGPFWTVDTMYWTRIKPNTSGRYAYYAAMTFPFDLYSTNTALPSMTKGVLNGHVMARPPLPEQTAIVAFLDTELTRFDTLTVEAHRAIELLQERRTALISAAVTGQIDVRGIETREFN